MNTTPIIDFHMHVGPHEQDTESLSQLMLDSLGSPEAVQHFERTYADPAAMVNTLRGYGVDYGVVLAEYAPLTTGLCTNESVEAYCRGHEELIPFASLNPFMEQNMPRALRALHARGFRGLKLYPTYNHFYMNEARMYPLYATAEELGLPILFHTGTSVFTNSRLKYGNPIDLDDVAVDFPQLTVLMAHAGRMAWYAEAMTLARLHEHVYIELSGIAVKRLPELFPDMERFSHKFVFGTDWPQVNTAKNIATLRAQGLSEQALERILGGNAAHILGLGG